MNIVGDVEKVRVVVDVFFLILSLPERTGAVVLLIEVLSVSHIEFFHEKRDAVFNSRREE